MRFPVIVPVTEYGARWGLLQGDEIGLPAWIPALKMAEVKADKAVLPGKPVVIECNGAVRDEHMRSAPVIAGLDERGVKTGIGKTAEKCIRKNVAGPRSKERAVRAMPACPQIVFICDGPEYHKAAGVGAA